MFVAQCSNHDDSFLPQYQPSFGLAPPLPPQQINGSLLSQQVIVSSLVIEWLLKFNLCELKERCE